MKCVMCGFYSHIKCSRVTPETLNEIECESVNGLGETGYKCLNCLLSGKTINHLIRESCEHYENIH